MKLRIAWQKKCGYEHNGIRLHAFSLCSYAIHTAGFEEDDFLLGFAEHVFYRGTYNDVILIYLCKYYNGATKTMAEIWKAAEHLILTRLILRNVF